jgi:16S rRNA (cytosine967-C5)-methyltransferase
MRLGGRCAAAIEILDEIARRHRPAADALRDWGKAHRFAGAADRHAIGTLVYDSLRKRNSQSHHMQSGEPRALALATLRFQWRKAADEIAAAMTGPHGPGALQDEERRNLDRDPVLTGDVAIDGDVPSWLAASFVAAFGADAARQGAALAERAPIDLRTNTLKTDRPRLLDALARYGALAGPLSPWCVRIAPPGPEARNTSVEVEPCHGLGWFEVQDAASQMAALLSGVRPGQAVADICAGAGGKTLALAAMLENRGRLLAHDSDRRRLRPIFERIQRSGASIIEVIAADEGDRLRAAGPFDCVLVDAPCSGSGSWRRRPDAKWRLTPKLLQQRMRDQATVLARAASLVKAGGRLVYITCSVLPEENGTQLGAFLAAHPEFRLVPYAMPWREAIGGPPPASADGSDATLLLSPATHGTDGFFVAVLTRA